jgi:hypothetical protein
MTMAMGRDAGARWLRQHIWLRQHVATAPRSPDHAYASITSHNKRDRHLASQAPSTAIVPFAQGDIRALSVPAAQSAPTSGNEQTLECTGDRDFHNSSAMDMAALEEDEMTLPQAGPA